MKRGDRVWRMTAVFVCGAVLLSAASQLRADVKLPHVFGSHMVLQQSQELPVWGWADPGETVKVTLGGHSVSTQADANGKWTVKLPAMKAGGPHEVTVAGKNSITLSDVLIGEVWVCSGQSNMEFPVTRAIDSDKEIATANFPQIRLFHVPRKAALTPQDDVDANWEACSPKTIGGFTAVGYFFGRRLQRELDVPIGLIESSWGGTRIEPWTPPVGFEAVPELKSLAEQVHSQGDRKDAKPNPQAPTHLYNGMIHPIVPFAMRGAIWYQGESNRADGMLYLHKMKALIRGWRSVWSEGDFPFDYVQLAPFRYRGDPKMLAEIWQAQLETLSVPNTGMAVTVDVGNLDDIHPRNKQAVGKRLALWALAKTYDKEGIVFSGPLYKSLSVDKDRIRVEFDHVGSGLTTRDGKPLSRFEIAGADGKFVSAQAKIDGDTVVVWSEEVTEPKAVRFGWDQEAEPNLSNKEGLPASPFRATLQ